MLLEVPKFHKFCYRVGLENHYKIIKAYREILGINKVSHFSINIESPDRKLAFVSSNPSVGIELLNSGAFLYDGTLSPTVYRKKKFYYWEDEYMPGRSEHVKKAKEYRFGINSGCIFTRRVGGFVLIYSFATSGRKEEFVETVENSKYLFLSMGDHCYSLVREIYGGYLNKAYPPSLYDLRNV
jgi:hypothetical protein